MNSPLPMKLYVAALLLVSVLLVSADSSDSYVVTKSSSVEEIYAACNVVKYPNGSELANNVDRLLKKLTAQTQQTGFSAAIYGEKSPNQVYGRLQCRGDLSPADCHACSVQAVESVGQQCPNAIGARVQLEDCFLRYENYSFLSKLDTTYWYGLVNVNSNTDDNFHEGVGSLVAELSGKAVASPLRFGLGWRDVSSNLTIYGMEMCWRDMSKEDCATCLAKGIEQMFSCCKERVGVQVFMGSCTLRYEIYPIAKNYGT